MGKNGAEERQPESRRPRVAAAYGRRAFFKAGAALTVSRAAHSCQPLHAAKPNQIPLLSRLG